MSDDSSAKTASDWPLRSVMGLSEYRESSGRVGSGRVSPFPELIARKQSLKLCGPEAASRQCVRPIRSGQL
jgi:hypothetical protein